MTCAWNTTYNLVPNLNIWYQILETNKLQNINDGNIDWQRNNKNTSQRSD
jgi:hypothetical protein